MARGTTVNTLVEMLRRELKIAENPALAQNVRPAHINALRSAQVRLWQEFDWPFKIIRRDVTLSAGERYYALPANLDFENIRDAQVLWSSLWFPIERGINEQDYNYINSDNGARLDPVRKWQIYNDPDTNSDMIEMWPIPVSNGGLVRFRGVKKLSNFVSNSDTADLDDDLLVLHAAIDFITNPRDVAKAQAKATRHYMNLRRNTSDNATIVSGGGRDPRQHIRPPQIVITPAKST